MINLQLCSIHNSPSLSCLPDTVVECIFQYVDQFDLIHFSQVSQRFHSIANKRLYKRVTVILNAEYPTRYEGDSKFYIRENGIKHMDSALILNYSNLIKFNQTLMEKPELTDNIKFFVFDKCSTLKGNVPTSDGVLCSKALNQLHSDLIDFFGTHSKSLNFLHITFIDFVNGLEKLNKFLQNGNIRNKLFKLFINSLPELYTPKLPMGITNLFLMLDELELSMTPQIDIGCDQPYEIFNSLQTLTFSTTDHLGLEIIRKFKLRYGEKLKLKGLTIFHCHKEADASTLEETEFQSSIDHENQARNDYIHSIDKHITFQTISEKIDITCLNQFYLKIDCFSDRNNVGCNCFPTFFQDLSDFSIQNGGLPNLESFELELFPNLEWLRPHQMLESILGPLGTFIKTLSSLSRLSIDFSTLGFKMFDNGIGLSSVLLNKLNERLMQAFFLCFFSTVAGSTSHDDNPQSQAISQSQSTVVQNLKSLQLPDFLTSFIYYKPDFYESFLHTCQCSGCAGVLKLLENQFYPLHEENEDDEDDDDEDGESALDLQSTYYLLIGFILGKLQADREVCIPIKKNTSNYRYYPIYKGQSHTLHHQFHKHVHGGDADEDCECKCFHTASTPVNDPTGSSPLNIDNLATTYIIHQLRPIVEYLTKIFVELDSLMIHGIYYEKCEDGTMKSVFDADEYPTEIKEMPIENNESIPFGNFKKII
ncbi:hypothetical protein CLIB1423_05S03642 [[Candida] railenensis]|uniref:F-box domain-containing protein n=1 Tax=[Candida] railenensis TaxID=45579 RepID=A0A9P0VX31_9ASCO|nr:hypothetical protein CLIB1423_05S03642 [[Candida] railenensis]